MAVTEVIFTESEHQAATLLFDAVSRVLGSDEHRIVDPVARILHLFDGPGDAGEFVRRLEGLNVLTLAFVRKDGEAEADAKPTYRAALERWIDVVSCARRVPDPPLKDEERKVRDAVARKRDRRGQLADRKVALELELRQVDEAIAAADAEIAEAEAVASGFSEWRRRVAKIIEAA